jgi:hypothetical protein
VATDSGVKGIVDDVVDLSAIDLLATQVKSEFGNIIFLLAVSFLQYY